MKMFSPKPNIGLDIGTYSIKLIELLPLAGKERKFKLVNFLSQPLMDRKKEEVLAEVVAGAGIKNRRVNICIGGEPVIVRLITIPKMSPEELKSSLKFEAEKYIPFNIEEVEMQAQILKDDLKDNKMQVLVAAAKKKNVEALINLVTGADIKPKIIDVDSFALYNAYEVNHTGLKETHLLLNIGAKVTNIDILEEGILSFSRDVFMGGETFTQQLRKSFGLDEAEAEALKKDPKDKKQQVLESLKPVLFNLKNEVSSSIDYFESQSQKKVSKIGLSGESAYLIGLSDFFKENFEVETEIWDPVAAIEKAPFIDTEELDKAKAQFAISVGLALRS